jgi:nucleotide-binding universal stress UspA family protein
MYTCILVAIDTSNTAQKALEEAVRLAKALGAALCIGHVDDDSTVIHHGMDIGTSINVERVRDDLRTADNQLLDKAVARAAALGCPAEKRLIEGTRQPVAESIADAAREWGADLVVIGTHGRRGFERMLVGCVAESLTRVATTSLMLVRRQS